MLTANLGESDSTPGTLNQLAAAEIGDEIAETFIVSEHLPKVINCLIGSQLNCQPTNPLGQTLNGLLNRLLTASGRSLKSRQGVGEVQPEKGNNGILMKVRLKARPQSDVKVGSTYGRR